MKNNLLHLACLCLWQTRSSLGFTIHTGVVSTTNTYSTDDLPITACSVAATPRPKEDSSGSVNNNSKNNNDKKHQRFMDWLFQDMDCRGEGAIKIKIKNGRRGVFVTQDLQEGSLLFSVPISSTILIEEEETTDAERGLKLLSLKDDSELKEEGWKAYWDILPTPNQHFDKTPDFWSDKEIKALEFPRLVNGALGRKKRIQSLAKKENVDVDELQFATWLVESRSLTLINEPYEDCPDEELESTSVMIPLVDLINHSSDNPNAELDVLGSDEDGFHYSVIATEDIPAGTEILISYGSMEESSADLLQYYGFVPETNPHDVTMLYVGGDDCFTKLNQWKTTIEEDEKRLAEQKAKSEAEEKALKFRLRMKYVNQVLDDDDDGQ